LWGSLEIGNPLIAVWNRDNIVTVFPLCGDP